VPSAASLAPFKGPRERELQGAREAAAQGKQLNAAQLAAVREHNRLISRYNELFPEAQAAIKAQDWKRASDLLQQLIEIAPYKWELYQNLGSIQRNLGRHADAVATLEKGLGVAREMLASPQERGKLNAAIVLISINQGEALVALNQAEAAAEKFRTAAELDPRPATAHLQLCSAEYNSGHAEAALSACKRAIAAEPLRAEAYQVLGGVESNLESYQEALHAYARGIEVALGNMRAAQPSPISNINSMQYADSSRAIGEGVRAGQMMQSAGNIYFHLGKYTEAAEMFRRAAGLHPYPALPLFNLCATLYDMNNFSAAASACDHAIEADAQMPDPYFVKGSALYGEAARKGRLTPSSDALAALEKYLQLAPDGLYAKDARSLLKEIAGKN
jgi:tetratricopeptide (TPR) repeat protein